MKTLFFCLSLCVMAAPVAAEPRLVMLDVGEGQALLLQQGARGVLIDTGHPGVSRRLLARLGALGVKRLDYLILTHLHPDHAGGYFRLREAFPRTPVLYSGHPLPADVRPDLVRWVNDALAQDAHRRLLRAGEDISWQGMHIEVLWPEAFSGDNLNRHSLVLLLHYAGLKLLIMGDADAVVEQALLEQNKLPADIDVLVAGHHGAADATSAAFVDRLHPRLALISVNAGNIRGYPGEEVLQRLEKAGARVLRTDRHGELRLDLCSRKRDGRCVIRVETER
ncbi:ComEC/Rec2 family competence protein [Thiolapillus sp.]